MQLPNTEPQSHIPVDNIFAKKMLPSLDRAK